MYPKVKLAFVVGSLGVGGAERHALVLADRMNRQCFATELVHLKAEAPLAPEAAHTKVPVWCPQAGSGLDLRAALRLAAHWRRHPVDAIVAANSYASLMAWCASRFVPSRPRLFSVLHSSPDLVGPIWREKLRFRLYARALASFQGLVYVSGVQRDAWRRLGFAPHTASTVVFNGIDPRSYASCADALAVRRCFGWDATHFVIGICASLRPEKRIADLLTAISLLRSRDVPARLLIVGDGVERQALERMVRDTLPPGMAAFAGFQAQVVPFIHACDVMALVSDTEAFSLSVLESMACGKPVLLTKVGGAVEQIEPGVHGFLVPRRSPELIADNLEQLWRSGEGPTMGARGRARVAALFSLDKMLQQYEQLLAADRSSDASALPDSEDFQPTRAPH